MSLPQGVFEAYKKDKTKYYRVSITYSSKHISLGSFDNEVEASRCYEEAKSILYSDILPKDYNNSYATSYGKFVTLINFRDNKMYIKTPIYLRNRYFEYHLRPDWILKFDVDDLFYYSKHKIMLRNGYMFVSDYGMQVNVLSRYGIKNHAVEGKDFIFSNGDNTDYRYSNIIVINKYYGVEKVQEGNVTFYKVKLHIKGNYVVGIYDDEIEAAIAYNKACDIVNQKGIDKNYPKNYIEEISAIQYASIYNKVVISKKIRELI